MSRWTVQRMIRDGRLTTVHNPVRAHDKIPVEQVDEMLEVV